MSDLERAYKETNLHGRDLAEIEIEARRDAHEIRDPQKNPYKAGTFASLVYTDELTKMRFPNGF